MIINLIQRIRNHIPKSFKWLLRFILMYPKYWFQLHRNYAYDRKRFGKYSSADTRLNRQKKLQSWIVGDYHKIEKALSLRSPRPGFGAMVISRLLENLEHYISENGVDAICAISINVLNEYVSFNKKNGLENLDLDQKINELTLLPNFKNFKSCQGGTTDINRDDILKKSTLDLQDFFISRHSIRQFSDKPVPREIFEKAISLASKTPSVCNRQSWKVYAFSEQELLERVVDCQKGNSGFGDQIKTILVVTSNTETFFSIGERNQCWIDGGMFSMSLVYALHSLGLGSICLNWSVEKAADENLHNIASIPESEAVIMLIGVGYLPEKLSVAQSCRKPVDEILVWNGKILDKNYKV